MGRVKRYFYIIIALVAAWILGMIFIPGCTIADKNEVLKKVEEIVAETNGTYIKKYSIGGTIIGLGEGKKITLQNNESDILVIDKNGSFVFDKQQENGSTYDVIIKESPYGQYATIKNNHGKNWHNLYRN